MLLLGRRTAEEKVAAFLLGLRDRYAHAVSSHPLYLVRQLIFLVKFAGGLCWGRDPAVRAREIPVFHLTCRFTTIKRLNPDNRRRPGRSPMMPPRLHRHSARGHILGGWLNGHVLYRSFEIPHLRASREKLSG